MVLLTQDQFHSWWADLRHSGLLISPALIEETFPGGTIQPPTYRYTRLRDRYNAFQAWHDKTSDTSLGAAAPLHSWLDAVLEDFLGHDTSRWHKGSYVPRKFTVETILGDRLRPNRILYLDDAREKAAIAVWVDRTKRVGMGRGRTSYSKLIEFLRAAGLKLGLLTNGTQFRLCYAGLDHDAWCEWEVENWFEEEELRRQLHGFFTLLGPRGFDARDGMEFPLLAAVEASRTRQGELSSVLGEQVRQAVERFLYQVDRLARKDPTLLDVVRESPDGSELSEKRILEALYQTASRLVMRMVVVLFAEARGLLPRTLESYNASYGLEGLFVQLRSAFAYEGPRAMSERAAAWPRILSLFQLIHSGCSHPTYPVQTYGGLLFRPGRNDSPDPVDRALTVFEDGRLHIPDDTILEVLELLKIGRVKIRRGRSAAWVKGPVNFSELRTEYIGIMYEGLLDYELRASDSVQVILNLGQQPVLPLETLENMPDRTLKDLLDKLGKEKASGLATEAEAEELEEDTKTEEGLGEAEEEIVEEEPEEPEVAESEPDTRSEAELLYERAHEWASRAVEVAGIVKKPTGRNPNLYQYERDRQAAARKLIARVIDQGEFYIAHWGGTRKGSGTFYTKPGLAVPTAQHTLEPLAYRRDEDGKLAPRTPEEILSLKICDPACGSGSFLVAALHYLTEALYQSLRYHQRIAEQDENSIVTLPFGRESKAELYEEFLPVPLDDERFEGMLKARLRRYVVERCLYGVDLNPMAVELARLSLWIETMDQELPFSFLDHKIKRGNSLIGCWFDQYQDYPIMAWAREGGDENHTNGVHFDKEEWTNTIKQELKDRIKAAVRRWIQENGPNQTFEFVEDQPPSAIHDEARGALDELHALPISADGIAERERLYKEKILDNEALQALRRTFDAWCAIWFWPADQIDACLTPQNFIGELPPKSAEIVGQLSQDIEFFHWELEFPDVFASRNAGFNAIVGNPPWDILKPLSKEFFSNYNPIYRTYGKQEAIDAQTRLFRDSLDIEREWLLYRARFKALSNWVSNAGNPSGYAKRDDPNSGSPFNLMDKGAQWRKSDEFHGKWYTMRRGRISYADLSHPYRHQGSADVNSYKMFLELSHALLTPESGRLGMIVPSGLYTDKGTTDLRMLFLDHCRWEWLFGFENRRKIFDTHRSYKFCPVVIARGGSTDAMKAAFMRHELTDWEQPERFISYPRAQVNRFSPHSRAILEIRTRRDLEILEKLYDGSVLLGDQSLGGWQIQYAREFDMTNDSKLFPPRPKWEAKGYRPDAYGRWILGDWRPISEAPNDGIQCRIMNEIAELLPGMIPSVDGKNFVHEDDIEDIALPLYEGRMIGQFDFSQKGWVSGTGRSAKWREIPWTEKIVEPQYLMGLFTCMESEVPVLGYKMPIMNISSATNARTIVSTLAKDWPCSHALNPVRITGLLSTGIMVTFLNSFVYDYAVRVRLGGLNVSFFILDETPVPSRAVLIKQYLLVTAASALSCGHILWAPEWLHIHNRLLRLQKSHLLNFWRSMWSLTAHERLRLRCILDAIIAELYGLSFDDFAWILRNDPSDPKGFWRVDQDKPVELRHTTLTLAAFRDLKEMGLEEFCDLPDPDGLPGCGWQIPKKLTYSVREYGIIEFDARDGLTVSVRERLGRRFLPWQLEGMPEESWAECNLHARNILGDEKFKQLVAKVSGAPVESLEGVEVEPVTGPDGQPKLFATGTPNLFGEDAGPPVKRRRS